MKTSAEANWLKYKRDFLKANRCTDQEFHDAYVAFMEGKPDIAAYRKFARKWKITIHSDPGIPVHAQVVLSVNISAIKVMARTYDESLAAVNEIFRKA